MATEDQPVTWFGKRKPRPMEELLRDNSFLFVVGRLIGQVEMAAHLLSLREEAEAKEIGTKLDDAIAWFYADEKTPGKP